MMAEKTLSITDLSSLNGSARLWIFQSSKQLTGELRTSVSIQLISFLKDWAAHGRSLFAAFEIKLDRFIIIAVDEAMAQATGCSVDKLMRLIQSIDDAHDLKLLDRMKVAYRSGEEIIECDVNTFSTMLANGKATEDTVVFNNVIQNLQDLQSHWEVPVKHSWHANLLP